MNNDNSLYKRAVMAFTELFYQQAANAKNLEEMEREIIRLSHACSAQAFGLVLKKIDDDLFSTKPHNLKSHNIRQRNLATEIGDGERWCRDAGKYLSHADVVFHLDPFHINRAVMACFKDKQTAWKILDVINDGNTKEAIALLRAFRDLGIARQKTNQGCYFLS